MVFTLKTDEIGICYKQMEKIILMPEADRINMGLKGREKIKKEFGINLVIDKYVEFLNKI